MRSRITILYLFFLYFNILAHQNNNLYFTQVNNKKFSGVVNTIVQDNQGFIWIGSLQGLYRYDGLSYLCFTPKDSAGLSDISILKIVEDSQKRLWIATANGLNCLDLQTYKFLNINALTNNTFKNQYISTLYFDKYDNTLWIGTLKDGIVKFNILTYEYKLVRDLTLDTVRLKNRIINSICVDKNRNLWIATHRGCFQYSPKNKKVTPLFYYTSKNVTIDSQNALWVVTIAQGIWKCKDVSNPKLEKIEELNTNFPNQGLCHLEDSKGNHWISMRNFGLYFKPKGKTEWVGIQSNKFKPQNIHTFLPEILYEDNFGNIWIGTADIGVEIVNLNRKPFRTYKLNFSEKELINENIFSMYSDSKNEIWFGTRIPGFLSKYNTENQTFTNFIRNVNHPNYVQCSSVNVIAKNDTNSLWVGTYDQGLYLVDKKTGNAKNFKNEPNNPNSLSDNCVYSVLKSKSGKLYVGSLFDQLNVYDIEKNKFSKFKYPEFTCVRLIYQTQDSLIWLGTPEGLIEYNEQTKKYHRYVNTRENHSISSRKIMHIFEDSKKRFWIGTRDGLNLMNRKTKTFKVYSTKDGLPSQLIYRILEDNQSNLWISTGFGLTKFDPEKELFRNYTEEDGLHSNLFSYNAFCKTLDGQFFLGGSNGITSFYPNEIIENNQSLNVILTDLKIFNKSVKIDEKNSPLTKHLTYTTDITLFYNQSVITIDYIALNYNDPQNIKYEYKIDGVDRNWNKVGNKRNATYTNLNAGEYTFRVKACSKDGIWSKKDTILKIKILPPWWKTWWFFLLLIAFFVLVMFIYYQFRISLIKKKDAELNTLIKVRTNELMVMNSYLLEQQSQIEEQSEELKAQSEEIKQSNVLFKQLNQTKDQLFAIIGHDLRNPFHQLIGFTDLLIQDYEKLNDEKIDKYLTLINTTAQNSNLILENLLLWSKNQTGNISVHKEEINVLDVVTEIKKILEIQAIKKEISINISVDSDLYLFSDINMTKTILRNLVSNAIKFTPINGKIFIEAKQKNHLVEITVEDNGKGIAPENINELFNKNKFFTTKGTSNETGTGLGLILCKELIEKNEGTITVESKLNIGTIFKFSLPSKQID